MGHELPVPPVKACLGPASCGPAPAEEALPSLKDCGKQRGRHLLWRARPDPDTGARGPRASPWDLSSLVCSSLSFCGIMSFLNSGKFAALTFPILPLWLCPHLVSAPGGLLLQTPVPAAPSPPHRARLLPASVRLLSPFQPIPGHFWCCILALPHSALLPTWCLQGPNLPVSLGLQVERSWCGGSVPGPPADGSACTTGLRLPLGGACAPDAPAWVCPAKHGMVSPLLTLSRGLSRRGLGHSPSPHTQRGTQFVPLSHLEAGVSALQGAGPQHGQSPCRSMGRSAGLYSAPAVFSALSWALVSQKELPPFLWDAARRVQSLRLWRGQGAAPWRTEAVSVFFTFRLEGITWK